MSDFDYEADRLASVAADKLAPIFGMFRWEWANVRSPDGIPTKNEIEDVVKRLINSARQHDRASTGRITVYKEWETDGMHVYTVHLDISETYVMVEESEPDDSPGPPEIHNWVEEGF